MVPKDYKDINIPDVPRVPRDHRDVNIPGVPEVSIPRVPGIPGVDCLLTYLVPLSFLSIQILIFQLINSVF